MAQEAFHVGNDQAEVILGIGGVAGMPGMRRAVRTIQRARKSRCCGRKARKTRFIAPLVGTGLNKIIAAGNSRELYILLKDHYIKNSNRPIQLRVGSCTALLRG